jgi:hypothetical protein
MVHRGLPKNLPCEAYPGRRCRGDAAYPGSTVLSLLYSSIDVIDHHPYLSVIIRAHPWFLMVFEEIIRSSPRRRASPWIAEGFNPTARGVYRIIAVLRYVDPCPGLPCRARRPFLSERRPKFISVTVLVARYWECSTPSDWFNLFGNCYKFSISIRAASGDASRPAWRNRGNL